MMSAFSKSLPHLLRRPLLLPTNTNNNCTTTILYNQYARRLASTSKQKKLQGKGKKKRAIASSKHKKRLAATSSSNGNAANSNTNTKKIKKPSKQAPPPPTPTPTAKLEKARHMQTNTLSTNEKEGLLGWFAANTSSRSLDRSEVGVSDTSIPHTNTSNTHSSDAAEINVLDGVLERVTAATGLDTHTVISAAIDHFLKK